MSYWEKEIEFQKKMMEFYHSWTIEQMKIKKHLFFIDGDNLPKISEYFCGFETVFHILFFHNGSKPIWKNSNHFLNINTLGQKKDASDVCLTIEAMFFHLHLSIEIQFYICSDDQFAIELVNQLKMYGRKAFLLNRCTNFPVYLKNLQNTKEMKNANSKEFKKLKNEDVWEWE